MKRIQIGGASLGNLLLRFVQGLIIGVGGILPGVSGGVLCIVFGLYQPVMEVFAAPIRNLKKHFALLAPVALGAAVGCFGLAHLVGAAMQAYPAYATAAFVGLILGTLPALLRTAREKPASRGSAPAFFTSFVLFFTLFLFLGREDGLSIVPNFFWYLLTGVIWGVSIVLPGLSLSSILIFLGLFAPLVNGAKSLDFAVLLPVGIGGIAAIALLARLVNRLFARYPAVMSYIILGVVAATTIPLIPTQFASVADFFVQVCLMVVGFAVALAFDRLGKKPGCE